jgi:putative addiction module component (TIGR02574 family)
MATLTKSDIASLSLDERLALIDDLWGSIEEPLTAEPPEWHREELQRILVEEERNPQPGVPWEQLRAEMTQKWLL